MLSLIKAESPWEAEMLYYNRIGTFDAAKRRDCGIEA
jgi:hypothetical protein